MSRYLAYDPFSGNVAFAVDNPRDLNLVGLRLIESEAEPSSVWIDTSGEEPVERSREPMPQAGDTDVLLGDPVSFTGVEAGRPFLVRSPSGSVTGLLASETGGSFTPDAVGRWTVLFIGRYSGERAYNVVDATMARDQATEAIEAHAETEASKVAQGWGAIALALKRAELAEYRGLSTTQQNALTVAQRAARFPFIVADAAEMGSTFAQAVARLTTEVELRLAALARVEASAARQRRDVNASPRPQEALKAVKERIARAR